MIAVWSAAAELQVVSLADALALCLLVRDREPARFARVTLRWHGRFCAETEGIDLEQGRLVLDLLAAVAGPEPARAGRALCALLADYDQALAEPLRSWEALRR